MRCGVPLWFIGFLLERVAEESMPVSLDDSDMFCVSVVADVRV